MPVKEKKMANKTLVLIKNTYVTTPKTICTCKLCRRKIDSTDNYCRYCGAEIIGKHIVDPNDKEQN